LVLRTPLYDLHVSLGARMVPFAGYEMPVQYPQGILAEHAHARGAAGLFDVSHMGQAFLTGPNHETVARALEKLVPGDILGLQPGQIRYTQFTSETGGTLDDLMVTRLAENGRLYLVVNASRKAEDYAWMRAHLPEGITLEPLERALVALQGPKAEMVLARHAPAVAAMPFMTAAPTLISGIAAHVSRSGYTGEDGYEISVAEADVAALVQKLLAEPEVMPIGLGARDSLRLEAGLCLYGHELDENISPVEAGLVWSIGKRRRTEGGFMGAERISRELRDGPARLRVGLKPEGRAPAREGTEIQDMTGRSIGIVTSGGFGASVGGPIAMGFIEAASAKPGTQVQLIVRGKPLAASVTTLPFIPTSYKKQEKRQ
jgi:aminomethyltransferase